MNQDRKGAIERTLLVVGAALAFAILDGLYADRDAKTTAQAIHKADQAKREVRPEAIFPLRCPCENCVIQEGGGRAAYACAQEARQ